MFTYESNDNRIPTDTDAYYEAIASQEETYLEEKEEEVRQVLESYDPPIQPNGSPEQQRELAAEELITGDSDDPPLSEETVGEMLRGE